MKVQILMVAVAVGLCTGLTIQREQRKFIYQDGYPSVRRYPVFPERHSSLEQTLPSALDDDIKNELEEESAVSPSTDEPLVPELEGDAPPEVPQDEAPSTDISPALESESTSTAPPAEPVTTPGTSFFDSTVAPDTAPLHLEGFSFTPKPLSILEESPSSLFSPENFPRDIILSNDPAADDGPAFFGNAPVANDGPAFFGNAPIPNDGPAFFGNAPVANDGSAFFGNAPVANDGSSSFFGNAPVANDGPALFGNAPVANDGSSTFFGNASIAEDESAFSGNASVADDGSAFFGNAPVANDESFLFGNPPVSNDGSFFIGNAPVANDGSSFVGNVPIAKEESAAPFAPPDSVFGRDDAGHREVFTADDARPIDPSLFPNSPVFRVSAHPSSFGVFTEATEESTDIPLTTDVVNNFLTGEEEVANSTIAPSEEGSERLSETVTEVPVFDQTVTEAELDSVTQDFVPTEETEAF